MGGIILSYENGNYYAQYGEDAATKKVLGEISKEQLIAALANSGLNLTTDSTPEQIYEALAEKFPGKVVLFNGAIASGQNLYTAFCHIGGSNHTTRAQASITGGVIRTRVWANGTDNSWWASWAFAKAIDLTDYKKLVAVCSTNTGGIHKQLCIGKQLPTTGTFPYTIPTTKLVNTSIVGIYEMDISDLTGSYHIWFRHQSTTETTECIVDFKEIYLSN